MVHARPKSIHVPIAIAMPRPGTRAYEPRAQFPHALPITPTIRVDQGPRDCSCTWQHVYLVLGCVAPCAGVLRRRSSSAHARRRRFRFFSNYSLPLFILSIDTIKSFILYAYLMYTTCIALMDNKKNFPRPNVWSIEYSTFLKHF